MNKREFQILIAPYSKQIGELIASDPNFNELHDKVTAGIQACLKEKQSRIAIPPRNGPVYNEFSPELEMLCKDLIQLLETKAGVIARNPNRLKKIWEHLAEN